ncbi:site-2 protease family protein [Candidatus Peregrinibacteria bacterium]|jgi:Zn-dependent protease|nr:site-2 protease family protein [Candidatus Peregrinibacteria bacterium]MBT4147938.1 site-2 protease family protein [Candidatus Peregrinibacteria bacterium]MBT4366366.1 site-2 protease family protein [Candidatus Peregrinibacteria bacterium]MBT4456104.1 site-2 protease family protein [Candidatus Peregrinibacteria bacterium]
MEIADWIYFLIAIVIILPMHEASHALVAYYLGDPTAKVHGRLTLDPRKHFDVMGFLMLVIVHFGWGKPVPVNPGNFKKPMRDSALTALAGPVSNFILAFAVALPLKYAGRHLPEVLNAQLWWIFDLSIIWGIFNLIPVPPLDGGKILGLIVPRKFERAYMKFQSQGLKYFVVFMLFDIFILGRLFDVSVVRYVIMNGYEFVRGVMLFGI